MMPTLRQVGTNHYRIPGDVLIDVFANEPILRTFDDAVFQQAGNTASIPSVESVVLMPDAHSGYGAPIGAVVATTNTLIPTGEGRRGIQPMPPPAQRGIETVGSVGSGNHFY